MTYILELLDKEIIAFDSKLSLLKVESERGFYCLYSKGFNYGSQMYLSHHINYLLELRAKIYVLNNDDDDDNI
jgi:hypothetical protein